MYQGTVQPVATRCTTCGAGPFHPKLERTHDRHQQATIVEATWQCGRCGSRYGQGIVETIPDEQVKK